MTFRLPLLPLLLLAALPAAAPARAEPAPVEDAEHRADRLRTIELNRRAKSVVAGRDQANARIRESGRQAQLRYERERAEWRRRVADCQAGDHMACER